MKKLFFYFATSFFSLLLVSCTNENESTSTLLSMQNSTNFTEEAEPYISPKMAETIAFLDTCTSVIPIEQLFPMIDTPIDDITSQEQLAEQTQTKSQTTLESYTGRTSQKILYKDTPVSITDVQISNWSSVLGSGYLQPGTYYLTAIAVYYQLIDNERKITKSYYYGTKMGVDPDDNTAIGYTLQNLASNVYLFTSYVYALKTNIGDDYLATFVPYGFGTINDTFSLTWYYLATSN